MHNVVEISLENLKKVQPDNNRISNAGNVDFAAKFSPNMTADVTSLMSK